MIIRKLGQVQLNRYELNCTRNRTRKRKPI